MFIGLIVLTYVRVYSSIKISNTQTNQSTTKSSSPTSDKWNKEQIVSYMKEHPNRAHFSRLFRDGGFKLGMEVGVADGRFSEHFLKEMKFKTEWIWTIVEPFPNTELLKRYDAGKTSSGTWKETGLLDNVEHLFFKKLCLDKTGLLDHIEDESYDFIYLDGDHSYKGVKQEMPLFWDKVRPGGVLAGHDYCNHGEESLSCPGCDKIPKCLPYTEYGMARKKRKNGLATNQEGVVRAVQEWLVEKGDDKLTLYHTDEDFTRESLNEDGMEYDLAITNTRNPSWFIVKPLK